MCCFAYVFSFGICFSSKVFSCSSSNVFFSFVVFHGFCKCFAFICYFCFQSFSFKCVFASYVAFFSSVGLHLFVLHMCFSHIFLAHVFHMVCSCVFFMIFTAFSQCFFHMFFSFCVCHLFCFLCVVCMGVRTFSPALSQRIYSGKCFVQVALCRGHGDLRKNSDDTEGPSKRENQTQPNQLILKQSLKVLIGVSISFQYVCFICFFPH